MAISLGSASLSGLALGDTPLSRVYLGTTMLWQAVTFTTDANITAIGADGWRATYSSPPAEFAPTTSPAYLAVNRPGFDATGTATTVLDGLTLMKRVREPYPNEAILTADQVALADFVYSTDTIVENGTTVTNNSALTYPNPQAMWLDADMQWVKSSTHTVRLAVAHAYARQGRPVAAVRFTATDTSLNSVSVTVSAMSTITYATTGLTVPHFAADLDLSGLNSGEVVTVDAVIYPWVGDAFTLSTDADAYPSPNLTVLKFLCDRSDNFGTVYAYVDGVGGGSPQASTSAATAEANPFADIAAAAAAIPSVNNSSHGRNNLSGGVIRLTTGAHALGQFALQSVGEVPLIIEPVSAANKATTFLQDGGASASNLLADKVHFRDLTIRRTVDTAFFTFLDSAATDAQNLLTLERCTFDRQGQTNLPSGSWLYRTGRCYLVEVDGDDMNAAGYFSTVSKMVVSIGSGNGCVRAACFHAAGCKDIASDTRDMFVSQDDFTGHPSNVGAFLGWCHLNHTIAGYRCVNFYDVAGVASIGARGLAVVGNVLEQSGGSTSPLVGLYADGEVNPVQNAVFMGNTCVGARVNILYQDTGTATVAKSGFVRFNVIRNRNMKSDVFGANANLVGNWPVIFQVGARDNSALNGSEASDAAGAGSWLGEVLALGDVNGSDASPLNAAFLDDQSADGAGGGDGDYTPGPATAVAVITAGLAPWSHDQFGRAIANDGTAKVGALQPA